MKTLLERLEAKAEWEPNSGCLLWVGATTWEGYGHIWIDRRLRKAHCVMYECAVGPIPAGLQLDHLCRTRACINPRHLEPVTPRENLRRSTNFVARNIVATHCPAGHPYDADNTARWANRQRFCRECNRRWCREYGRRRRAARAR